MALATEEGVQFSNLAYGSVHLFVRFSINEDEVAALANRLWKCQDISKARGCLFQIPFRQVLWTLALSQHLTHPFLETPDGVLFPLV